MDCIHLNDDALYHLLDNHVKNFSIVQIIFFWLVSAFKKSLKNDFGGESFSAVTVEKWCPALYN